MSDERGTFTYWLERTTDLNRTMLLLALLVMLASAGFGVILPFLPLHAEALGASPLQIGLMVSAFALGSAAANLVGGRMADRVGRKRSIVLGLLLFALATLLLGLVRTPNAFILIRALEGAGFGLLYPSANALAQDLAPEDRLGRALGAFSTITLLGSLSRSGGRWAARGATRVRRHVLRRRGFRFPGGRPRVRHSTRGASRVDPIPAAG